MKKKNLCPYKALIIIVNNEKHIEGKVLAVLKNHQISRNIISLAQGTAESTLSDFFGFGIVEKLVISSFIEREKTEEIINELQQQLQLEQTNKGILFTLPLNALSSNIIGLWRNKE